MLRRLRRLGGNAMSKETTGYVPQPRDSSAAPPSVVRAGLRSPAQLVEERVERALETRDELLVALKHVRDAVRANWCPGGRVVIPIDDGNRLTPELAVWVGATFALCGWTWCIGPPEPDLAPLLGEGGLCLYLVSVVGSGANLCLDGLELVLAEVRALQDEVRGLRDKVDKLV